MIPEAKRTRRGNRHASAETRLDELLRAAERCFGRYGYASTTIDKIGSEAGLSKGTVYRFFESKEAILIALLDHCERLIEAEIKQTVNQKMPVLEQIRLTQRTTLAVLSSVPELVGVWQEFAFHDAAKPRLAKLIDAINHQMAELLQAGIKSGEIRDQPIEPILDFLEAHKEGLLSLAVMSEDFDLVTRFDHTWPLVKSGLTNV